MVASGFSQKTGLPAAIEASTYCSCVGPQDATTTASTCGSAMTSSPVACTVATPYRSATAAARPESTSVTAMTAASSSTVVSRRTWSSPIRPTPITPTRTVISHLPDRGWSDS